MEQQLIIPVEQREISPALHDTDNGALRVLQAGAILTVIAAVVYKQFELDRFFVPKELVLHLTAVTAIFFSIRSLKRVTFTWVDAALAGYLALGVISGLLATNGWLAARALTISASGIGIFWVARLLREDGLEQELLNAIAIAVALAAVTSLLQTYGLRTDMFSVNRAPGGTLGNRNFVAHISAIGFPIIVLAALRAPRISQAMLPAFGSAVVAASLVLTRSRAGYLAAAAALATIIAALFLSPSLRRDARSWVRLGVILLVSGVGVGAALIMPNSLRWRSENPYLESFKGVANYQQGSGRGRLVQYGQSLKMAAHHPLFGVGPGNWPVEYPKTAANNDPSLDSSEPGTTSNPWPSSDWVGFAAERGFPAVLLLAAALIGIALSGVKQVLGTRDPNDALSAGVLLATLAAVLVAGLFDAVLLLALPALLVWASLGALWSPQTMPGSVHATLSVRARMAGIALALVLSFAGVIRSGAQVTAMSIYGMTNNRGLITTASLIDPGNYRLHMWLARNGRTSQRCPHARAARELLPSAAQARALARGCKK